MNMLGKPLASFIVGLLFLARSCVGPSDCCANTAECADVPGGFFLGDISEDGICDTPSGGTINEAACTDNKKPFYGYDFINQWPRSCRWDKPNGICVTHNVCTCPAGTATNPTGVCAPTPAPTRFPTPAPTDSPTRNPTKAPTKNPTKNPTENPTKNPTENPTEGPTKAPTDEPTKNPTKNPTENPTDSPTDNPTPEITVEKVHGGGHYEKDAGFSMLSTGDGDGGKGRYKSTFNVVRTKNLEEETVKVHGKGSHQWPGGNFKTDYDCLKMIDVDAGVGGTAWIGGFVRMSDNTNLTAGDRFVILVQDNGEGKNAEMDDATSIWYMMAAQSDVDACMGCDESGCEDLDITCNYEDYDSCLLEGWRGNIQIKVSETEYTSFAGAAYGNIEPKNVQQPEPETLSRTSQTLPPSPQSTGRISSASTVYTASSAGVQPTRQQTTNLALLEALRARGKPAAP